MTTTLDIWDDHLDDLGSQVAAVADQPFYRDHYADAAVDPTGIDSLEAFAQLPFTTTADIQGDVNEHPPMGSLYDPAVTQVNLTPTSQGLMPEPNTEADLDRMAAALADQFAAAGIDEGDVVVQCLGYNLFIGGWAMHLGLQALGAAVVPAGPGESEQTAGLVDQLEADAMIANPSFALKVASQADLEIDTFVGAGEPFTSVPGKREEVRDAFVGDPTVVDLFGLSELLPVAAECEHETGLHVAEDYVIVEVIDPETEAHVDLGERGEVVLTHLAKDAMPLIRYRTGDLTVLDEVDCACGRTATLPNGVYGRVDNRLKVKGVKLYPDGIRPVLTAFPALTGDFQIELTRDSGVDRFALTCEAADPTTVDTDELAAAIEAEILLAPDSLGLVETLDSDTTVVDHRE
jgi:phenylacetate-CoA ligase